MGTITPAMHLAVLDEEFPYFPQISQYVSTLFTSTESIL